MSTPENLKAPPFARKRKRELIEELEWEATVIDHQEIKEEEQAQTEWLRQCEERKKAFRVKKQKVLEKADELRKDGLEEQELCLPDSDVEILNKDPFTESQRETLVSRVDSGRAIREARKDNPIPSVELSPAAKTLAAAPDSATAPLPAVIAATTAQAIPSSSQPSFTPIRPPMSYLLKLKLRKLKGAALPLSGEDYTSDNKRRELSFPRSSQSCQSSQSSQPSPYSQSPQCSQTSLSSQSSESLPSSQSSQCSQFSQSEGVATEITQIETHKDPVTSVPSPKPAQPMLAPSRNTKRLTLTPENTPAAPETALQTARQPAPVDAPEPASDMVLETAPETAHETAPAPIKRRPGRPKGVKNKPKPVQQRPVPDGAAPSSQQQKQTREAHGCEANEQSRSSSYLEVEAPAQGNAQPAPTHAVTGNREPLQKANKQVSATKDGQVPLPERTVPEASCVASTRVPESASVGGQGASGWMTVNRPQTASVNSSASSVESLATVHVGDAATSHMQQRSKKDKGKQVNKQSPRTMQVLIRAGSEVCFDENGDVVSDSQPAAEKESDLRVQQEGAANRAQEKSKKEDELRAQQEAEEEAKQQARRRFQWDAEEESREAAARRAQQEAQEKAARLLDEAARRAEQRRKRRTGRDASVMRHGTPLRNSGTTREIERMKKMSIVVANDDGKRARKLQTTKEMLTPAGSAAQAQQEKKKDNADARVCEKPGIENRERSVAPQKIDVLMDREPSPDGLVHEELLDAIDKMDEAEANQEDDTDDRDMGPTPPATQTPPEQISKTSSVEPEQQVLLAPVQGRRPVPMADFPTPPASQELLKPSIESDEQEDAVTPFRQAGSSTIARLTTPAETIAALPATPSFLPSGGTSAVMFGVISRLTINLPEEMQKKVVEYVLSMEKTISELQTPPVIYTGHPATPFFQTSGRPSAMWHEVITTLAMDLSEEEQKEVVEYTLVLKKNKKQSVRSKTIG